MLMSVLWFDFCALADNPYGTGPQAPADSSFCDRLVTTSGGDYTNPTDAYNLMLTLTRRAYNGAVRDGTVNPPVLNDVQGLVNNPNTIHYFDGTIQYRAQQQAPYVTSPYYPTPTPNYRANPSTDGADLDKRIASWFGAGFGCTGGGQFTTMYAYTGHTDMVAVHSAMQISQLQFSAFIDQFSQAALSLGATQHDFDENVVPYLVAFGRGAQGMKEICSYGGAATTDPSTGKPLKTTCTCAPGWSGPTCTDIGPSSTGVTVDPGTAPTNAKLGAASAIEVSMVSIALAAMMALVAKRV